MSSSLLLLDGNYTYYYFCNRLVLSSVSVISGSYGESFSKIYTGIKNDQCGFSFRSVQIEKYETCQCMAIVFFVIFKSRW